MTNQEAEPGPAEASTQVSGKSLLIEGRDREALEYFAGRLETHPEDAEAVDGASRALIELVRSGTIRDALDPARLDRLYRTLILQEACPVGPPILHHLIASRETSGEPETVRKMAGELGPVLADLGRSGQIDGTGVLMLLVMRNDLAAWVAPDEISRRHLEWFSTFTLSDLSLPYSCMFSGKAFGGNRDDLARVIADPVAAPGWLAKLSLVQVVFLEWLLGISLVERLAGGDLRALIAAGLAGDPVAPEERAAAKSLLVAHGWGSRGADPAWLASVGLEADLAGLITSVGEAREAIRRVLDGHRDGFESRLFRQRAWQGAQGARNLAAEKVPAIFGRRRKPRAAICISGQLRGFRPTFETWKRTLLPLFDHDLFVHSWSRVGRSGAEPYRNPLPFEGETFQQKYREICFKLGFEEFQRHYPILLQGLADTGNTTEAEVAAFYGTEDVRLDDETDPRFAGWSNSDKMHFKIQACAQLMADRGREYDLIVRVRPDLPFRLAGFDPWQLRRICHQRPVIFADHGAGLHYVNPMIGDQVAIGAPGPMQVYASTCSIQPGLARHALLQVPPHIQGHSSLAQVCWAHGIAVEKVPLRVGKLTDPAPLSLREIRAYLEADASGRDDWTDRLLNDAVLADLGPSA